MSLETINQELKEVTKYFPKLIANRRKAMGVSKEDAARDLSVSVAQIDYWESGIGFPNMDNIINICEYYFISLDKLFRVGYADDQKLEDILPLLEIEDVA